MKKLEFNQRYSALRKRRSGFVFPGNLPIPRDLVAAAAGLPGRPEAQKPVDLRSLQVFPRLKATAISNARVRRELRKARKAYWDPKSG